MALLARWRNVALYTKASILIAFGGFLFGLDTGTIGPVTTMTSFTTALGTLSSTQHGLVISSILLPAALTSLIAGNLADTYGRIQCIVVGSAVFGLGATLEASAPRLAVFVLGRVVKGLGEGLYLSLLAVYVCEITPAAKRGVLASVIQFLVTVGLAAGYFVSYAMASVKMQSHAWVEASWRVPLALQALMAFVFAVACSFAPPSPRWLVSVGKTEEAQEVWRRLGVPAEEREVDRRSLEVARKVQGKGLWVNIKSSFASFPKVVERSARRQTALGCFLMGMQQFSGIDGVLYYAPLLFRQAGLSSEQASFLASGVSALVILAVTVPASIYVDRWGRRSSTVTGGVLIAGCMLLIGSLYASNSVHGTEGVGRWVVIATIYVFAIAFSATWAIGIRTYATEIQPLMTRASATSLAQSSNWIANWIIAFTTPIFLARSSYGVYFLFGGMTMVTVVVCLLFMPETRGRTLESIDASFRTRSRTTMPLRSYRTRLEA